MGQNKPLSSVLKFSLFAVGAWVLAGCSQDEGNTPKNSPELEASANNLTGPVQTIIKDKVRPPLISHSTRAEFGFYCRSSNWPCIFKCKLDSNAWKTCASPKSYSGLVEGGHTFQVRSIDSAGFHDRAPAGYDWTIADLVNSWLPTSLENAPSQRKDVSAVWTGSEMIIWGGHLISGSTDYWYNDGGRYDPASDSWTPTSTGANVPAGESGIPAIWTGTEMIIWYYTGGRYNPASDSWTEISNINSPQLYTHGTAIWTGTEMIVWGTAKTWPDYPGIGGKYNPLTDSWTATSTTNAPLNRWSHTAVWTGSEMVIWGGTFQSSFMGLFIFYDDGGRYDPVADSWTATSLVNAPSERFDHTAVWTGTEMIVWGGAIWRNFNTGGRYNPLSDSWIPTSTGDNVPEKRTGHTAVWTGTEMIVWGGARVKGDYPHDYTLHLNTGGKYNPGTDSWTSLPAGPHAPAARSGHTAVWASTQMIIWGGYGSKGYLNSGGRYWP